MFWIGLANGLSSSDITSGNVGLIMYKQIYVCYGHNSYKTYVN
jgi:hypothetical protein